MSLDHLFAAYSIDPGVAHMHDVGEMPVRDNACQKWPPKVMFIGEAPGATEQRSGEPFVGASGRVLRELLAGIGLLRTDVYITNVVKYRPMDDEGKNRPPSPQEIHASMPYLRREMHLVAAPVLAVLGRFAKAAVLPDAPPVSVSHGQRYPTRGGKPCVVLYHPAVALYQPKSRDMLVKDFAVLQSLLKEEF